MTQIPPFPESLDLIAERSAALRSAVAAAHDLEARVPGCPDWSLRDLVAHLGRVQRFWAAGVTAGPAAGPPPGSAVVDPRPAGDLLAWSAESTRLLLESLRAAGPDRDCWTWWGASDAPMTSGAVARHQVQEAAVHAYDAQETVGKPEPIPADVAVDIVDELLVVTLGSLGAWPHRSARVALSATEGPTWTIDLTPGGARPGPAAGDEPVATLRGSAGDLVLVLYTRIPLDRIEIDGDREVAERFQAWTDTR
ncbi:maleylpyruvate isomerase family mycothiol-dependent enzyme [Actinoplanes sp. NPDC049118]|uniref:maleylpyruvate isomerase family mycothiol-dependent enzyme n=1 Tax=Actinoplanes sp. NPDC049118 TaxID=3155769 RepID=UPI0033D1964D